MDKLNPNQRVVFYEHFFEHDCFGNGDWSNYVKIFESNKEAKIFIESITNNSNYRNIYGPLKQT